MIYSLQNISINLIYGSWFLSNVQAPAHCARAPLLRNKDTNACVYNIITLGIIDIQYPPTKSFENTFLKDHEWSWPRFIYTEFSEKDCIALAHFVFCVSHSGVPIRKKSPIRFPIRSPIFSNSRLPIRSDLRSPIRSPIITVWNKKHEIKIKIFKKCLKWQKLEQFLM